MGIPVFLLMQCNSGFLYFLHKLLKETAYLRSMKSPGGGGNYGLTVGNRLTSEREMVERNHSAANPVLFVKSCKFLLR